MQMLDLNDFRYFVRIVECGGLTAASRNLNVPKSTVSHRLQQLEASLGVRLINWTSRSLSTNDAGDIFYRHAVAILEGRTSPRAPSGNPWSSRAAPFAPQPRSRPRCSP